MRTSKFNLFVLLLGILFTACAQREIAEPISALPDDTAITNNSALIGSTVIDVELYILMEGPYRSHTKSMITDLNQERGLLPGQTLIGLGAATPPGQPYSADPWNFKEEDDESLAFAEYPLDVVDWVLVAFRTGISSNTQIVKTAAWVQKDGKISFLNPSALRKLEQYEALYVVVEHRNHMAAMTPEAITIRDNALVYDFSKRDSYRVSTSYGQKQLSTGEWVMFAGDADQSDQTSYDINAYDKIDWVNENGTFGHYKLSDLNLDGDVNLLDKALWAANNGKLSAVPK